MAGKKPKAFCIESSPFGFGPFPDEDGVVVCAPNPPGRGYGAQSLYGFSPYGVHTLPRVPFPPEHGMGAEPYGLSPYGNADKTSARVASAISVSGTTVEVYFSEPVSFYALHTASKWSIAADFGETPYVKKVQTKQKWAQKKTNPDTGIEEWYVTAVLLTHSGTVLGGRYLVTVEPSCVVDAAGNVSWEPTTKASFLALGETTNFSVEPKPNNKLEVTFEHPMGEGLEDVESFEIIPADYPVKPSIVSIERKSDTQAVLSVTGMTTLDYTLIAGPAQAIQYSPITGLPSEGAYELGAGTSTVQGSTPNTPPMLLLSKESGSPYGWHFAETETSRLKPGSVFLAGLLMDASLAVWDSLPMTGTMMGVHLSDGDVQLSLLFGRSNGSETITLSSGTLSVSVPCAWNLGLGAFFILRNQRTKHWAVIYNGIPLISVALDKADGAPTMSAGVQFVVGSSYKVSGLPLYGVRVTASSTLYSKVGNFLHEQRKTFFGLGDMARNTLRTQRGPLTKGWGDSRPANIEDVEVRVNGTVVELAGVNPYMGEVETVIPIPRMPEGEIGVEVDYKWFPTPRMEMTSLNTMGLVLNKWDIRSGRNSASSSLRDGGGSREGERFPMCIGIGQPPEWNPKWISHRHIGFEREYTAALNEPTSLVLNANPNLYSPKREVYENPGFMASFEGDVVAEPWHFTSDSVAGTSLEGSDYYLVETGSAGGIGCEVPLAISHCSVRISARTQVQLADAFPSGAFHVGPAIAFHNNGSLKCAAAVKLGDLEHFGILEGEDPNEIGSWNLGPFASVLITKSNTLVAPPNTVPPLFKVGHKFQIREGVQAGVYECVAREPLSDGSVQMTVTPDFPFEPDSWEGGKADVLFEARWTENPFTWSLVGSSDVPGATLAFSGELAWSISSLNAGTPVDSLPPNVADTTKTGQVLWGHLFTQISSRSSWSFVRHAGVPHDKRRSSIGHLVSAEMSDLPQDSGEWFRNSAIGTSTLNGDGSIRLQTEAVSVNGAGSVGYERFDPLVPERSVVEVQGRFKVNDAGTCTGDAGFIIQGPTRDIRVSTILYGETNRSRRLVKMPSVSLTGEAGVEEQGWEFSNRLIAERMQVTPENRILRLSNRLGSILKEMPDAKNVFESNPSRSMYARLSVSHDGRGADAGVGLTMEVGSPARLVALTFLDSPKRVCLSDGTGDFLAVECDWSEEHVYEVHAEHSAVPTVTLHVDGEVRGAVSLTQFAVVGPKPRNVSVHFYGKSTAEIELAAFSVRAIPLPSVKRTVGIYTGGDLEDIDNWVLPRTDDFQNSLKNSRKLAQVQQLDWRQWTHLRVTIDPTWGVALLAPDKPLPASYDPKMQATEYINPSAALCAAEWKDLPLLRQAHTRFGFGSQKADSISQVDWDFFKYRVLFHKDEAIQTLRGAVLNRYNVITSGELGQDLTVDEVRIPVTDRNHLDLRKGHVSANRVFVVSLDGATIPSDAYEFDRAKQVIHFHTPISSDVSEVSVKFSPGTPVTKTYLETQPLYDGVTNLNEGTPPISWTQSRPWQRGFLPASRLNEISDVLNIDDDFVLNDSLGSIAFTNHKADVFADVSFMEIADDGHTNRIAVADDGPAPGQGFAGLEIEGRVVHDRAWEKIRPDFDQRAGSMGGLLHLAGGGFKHTGLIGGGKEQGAVVWPSEPANPPAPNVGAAEVQTKWDVRTSNGEDVSPPHTDGAYVFEHGGPYSRVGPWGGLVALNSHSLLFGGSDVGGGMVLQGGGSLPSPTWSFGKIPD